MTTVAIIQARTGSTRLPGKILKMLGGRSVIRQVHDRVQQAGGVDRVVIAIPEGRDDDTLAQHLAGFTDAVFRGSETDVLARYMGAAVAFKATRIIRITSDCPFIDPDIVSQMLIAFDHARPDYMSNTLNPHLPRGLDTEIFTAEALRRAFEGATRPHEREHVTPFLYQNPDDFALVPFRAQAKDVSDLRWTLDTPEDWHLIQRLYDLLECPFQQARLADVLALYEDHPELREINGAILQKTLEQ